jgi:hypothetical protein
VRALVLALLVVAGCANQRHTALTASLVTVNTARDTFVEWDRAHQLALVHEATSREQIVARLDEYRKKREGVVRAFAFVYAKLAKAFADDTEDATKGALAVAKNLVDTIQAMKPGAADPPLEQLPCVTNREAGTPCDL